MYLNPTSYSISAVPIIGGRGELIFGKIKQQNIMSESLIFGKIKYVKDEIVTSTGFTNATPQRKVLFIDRVTGQSNGFEGVITKVMYNQSINSTSINTCVMQSTIETRVVKVGDFVIIKEEYILYKGNPFEHVFIFLSINVRLLLCFTYKVIIHLNL